MTWINPPKHFHKAEHDLPKHHNETGLVWQGDDGSVWETRTESVWSGKVAFREVIWCQCHTERAAMLLEKYETSPGQKTQ